MQEIVVYRHPLEAAFWQMFMSGECLHTYLYPPDWLVHN